MFRISSSNARNGKRRNGWRLVLAALALAAGTMVAADFAEARMGRSGSFGSRGSRTWSTPAPTPTAPTAQPMQRSATPNTTTQPGLNNAARPTQQTGGLFNRPGFMGGLMGGLLGAGLFGLLMGGGFFSGLGSLSGFLGLLLQIVLIVIVARLVMGWLRGRNQPAPAGGPRGEAMARDAYAVNEGGTLPGATRTGFGTGPRGRPLQLQGADFDTFERMLAEVQEAYGRDDRGTLRRRLTPEMFGYISEELDDLARDGLANRLSDVRLLQGDLSEAWSEDGPDGPADYATVAMRYELKDTIVERASGRLVQGDPDRPTQVREFWTFLRHPGAEWTLSAIQQA